MPNLRFKYQTIEFAYIDIHVKTLKDTQQFYDHDSEADKLGINSASWSLFGVIWPSSKVLANFIFNFDTKSKKILEVGCGIGLSSLLLNHIGKNITATDYHPEVEAYLTNNTELNNDKKIPFFQLDWANTDECSLGKFDLIIGSDVLYQRDHIELLSNFINKHAQDDCEIIIVDPNRGNRSKFTQKMIDFGFEHQKIDTNRYIDTPFKGAIYYYNRKI